MVEELAKDESRRPLRDINMVLILSLETNYTTKTSLHDPEIIANLVKKRGTFLEREEKNVRRKKKVKTPALPVLSFILNSELWKYFSAGPVYHMRKATAQHN